MFVVALIAGLFVVDNQEFFDTVERQVNIGYSWEYVGKQPADGSPALTVKDEDGNEFIYFKLNKASVAE